jgi:hypothetical protein
MSAHDDGTATGRPVRPVRITGYAIVSDDDKIAGADGLVPLSLRNEKDWELYQEALARADLVVFGHRSHDAEPNVRGDLRVVVSREADGLERRAEAWWWSPVRVPWDEVAKRLLPHGGDVAAPGGQVVFDLFLKIGYDGFHLSRAHSVKLPGGRAIFSACEAGLPAETILAKAGLRVTKTIPLDPDHGVDMQIWRAASELVQAPSA